MKTKWILVIGVLLLLASFVLRERMTNYEDILKGLGQTSGQVSPTCPEGMTLTGDSKKCEKKTSTGNVETTTPTCPPNHDFVKRGTNWACVAKPPVTTTPENVVYGTSDPRYVEDKNLTAMLASMGIGTQSQASGPGSPIPGSAGVGSVTGTTTGGTSGMSFGPTTQSKMLGKTVWGPASKGVGEPTQLSPAGGDSSKSTPYPVLLGGETGKSSTRVEGVGVVPPSGSGLGSVVPSSTALGTDPNSGFLPYSRQPGDQDVIPDPYRLAKNFSTSSYSMSKTDPVPFLTDFSAFYK